MFTCPLFLFEFIYLLSDEFHFFSYDKENVKTSDFEIYLMIICLALSLGKCKKIKAKKTTSKVLAIINNHKGRQWEGVQKWQNLADVLYGIGYSLRLK